MTFEKRGHRPHRAGDVYRDDEPDPEVFFGEAVRTRKANFKALQLGKQVERAVSETLASEWLGDALAGAWVAAVEPAPDAGRLLVTVLLDPRATSADVAEARAALCAATAVFRSEVARSIHRKRVPELAFDVRPAVSPDPEARETDRD